MNTQQKDGKVRSFHLAGMKRSFRFFKSSPGEDKKEGKVHSFHRAGNKESFKKR